MQTLNELMIKSDKAEWGHNYCVHYEKWFEPLRNEVITLIELGIGGEDTQLGGESLKGWAEYFPNAIIAGIDIYDKSELDTARIQTFKGSQDDEVFLNQVVKELGGFEICIDDASHVSSLTIKSFEILFPLLKPGGLYFIEDLHTTFRGGFEGSHNLDSLKSKTILNYLFKILQELNLPHIGISGYKYNPLFKDIESIHFYPELVVIKKK